VSTGDGAVHPVTYCGTAVLHRQCRPVTVFDDALRRLVDDAFASMYAAGGQPDRRRCPGLRVRLPR
jgi:peptide deformylase